ncbi:MAG TPA: ABC transporter permease, partial [Candidatus Latescibacteria bacterium]|nr:ABC transporter permease [Candidatus Latescibacterota bacterium]
MSEAKVGAIDTQETATETEEQDLAFASQWQLMWIRFRRHRLALMGSAVLVLLYGVAAICEFISPYDPNQRHADYV